MLEIKKIILRLLLFTFSLFLVVFLGWWMFLLFAIFYGFFVFRPYEMPILGALLGNLYFFGPGIFETRFLLIVGSISLAIALLIEDRVNWPKLL
jgi:hypothetical protein